MDGEIAFRSGESVKAMTDVSIQPETFNPSLLATAPLTGRLGSDAQTANLIHRLCLRWVTTGAAIMGTFAAAWAGHLFLTPGQVLDQAMPDAVALLVFFLASRQG